MRKVNLKTRNRRFILSPNVYLRTRIRNYRNNICFYCGKIKKSYGSAVFFSDQCKTKWNDNNKLWHVDSNDYCWICRHCLKGKNISQLNISDEDWSRYQLFEYHYPESSRSFSLKGMGRDAIFNKNQHKTAVKQAQERGGR